MEEKNMEMEMEQTREETVPEQRSEQEHHHSQHSHHHSHHRHRHRHHRRRRKTAWKDTWLYKFLKKRRSVLINVASCTLSLALLILSAVQFDRAQEWSNVDSSGISITQSSIHIESDLFLQDVQLVNKPILDYYKDTTGTSAYYVYRQHAVNKQRLDIGISISYRYQVTGLPGDMSLDNAVLELSESPTFDDLIAYPFAINDKTVELRHLKTGTTYYYRLKLKLSTSDEVGVTGTFNTVESPRILSIGGINNVRDIGGWKTIDGKTIKQGLLYRGSEIDGAVEPTFVLTEQGKQDMLSILGIRFDMDLRLGSESNGDPLGDGVLHKIYGAPMYRNALKEQNAETIRSIFADLAKEENYPIYLHCTYGKDRTGTVCYLLEALLGLSDDDLRKEFELSAFTDGYVGSEQYAEMVAYVQLLAGETTAEKVEGFLLSIGVTAEEISNIRQIFLQ